MKRVKGRHMPVTVVGVGPAEGYLTERAKDIISRAEVVFGSRRALKLAEPYIRGEKVEMTRFSDEELNTIQKAGIEKEVAVLSTGDPMVSGLGTLVKGRVEPGISSVQLALARLGIDLCEVVVIDAHARESYHEIFQALRFRNRVLILADRKFDLNRLLEPGNSERVKIEKFTILTNLGMEDEEIMEINLTGNVAPEDINFALKSDLTIIYVESEDLAGNKSGSQTSEVKR